MDLTEPYLEILSPEGGEPVVVPLTKPRITIGRDPSRNDVVLQPDPQRLVSRGEHCFLQEQGSYWYIGCSSSRRNPTFLKRGEDLCFVQNNVLLTDGNRIYIQGRRTATGSPVFWICQFRDPEGTQPGQVAPYLAYEWRNHKLFRVVGGVSDAIRLSPHEDQLFQCLWACNEEHHTPSLVPVAELMYAVWEKEAPTHSSQELHKLVSSLRKKIELDPGKPQFLRNEQGKGYILDAFPLPEIHEEVTG
ncbi:MAG: winged helix-turn-helix domain-containing protein [Ktedonobacteraceae bacterium]